MKMRRSAIQLTVVASLWLSASISQAALFTGIFAFGDSLTDSGNTSLATGGAMPGASYYNGRYSNGPVWAEKLAGQLALPGFSASLAGGNDYAWAGAYTQTGGSVPTVTQQAAGFIGAGKTFLATDLIVVWAGANDFLLGGQLDPTIPAGNLAGIISTLAGAGARNFLLPNLPDLGDTPELISTGNAAAILGFSQLSMALMRRSTPGFQTWNPVLELISSRSTFSASVKISGTIRPPTDSLTHRNQRCSPAMPPLRTSIFTGTPYIPRHASTIFSPVRLILRCAPVPNRGAPRSSWFPLPECCCSAGEALGSGFYAPRE